MCRAKGLDVETSLLEGLGCRPDRHPSLRGHGDQSVIFQDADGPRAQLLGGDWVESRRSNQSLVPGCGKNFEKERDVPYRPGHWSKSAQRGKGRSEEHTS